MSVVFTTARLRARSWAPEDAEAGFAIYSDPEVMRYLGDGTGAPVPSVEAMRRTLEARAEREAGSPFGMWALEQLEDGIVVGSILLIPLENRGPDIEAGWHLGRAHWGNGYATEAGRAILSYAFDTLGLERVIAVVYPQNEASLRVAERIGMRRDGRMHAYGRDLERFVAEPTLG
ncbi:MAG TPA: GNAT family N-acetyltransferase [Actinomycetota bacterium]